MRVRYTVQAQRDLDSIYTYLDQRSPAAAQSVKNLIERRWASGFSVHGAQNERTRNIRADNRAVSLQGLLRDRGKRGADTSYSR